MIKHARTKTRPALDEAWPYTAHTEPLERSMRQPQEPRGLLRCEKRFVVRKGHGRILQHLPRRWEMWRGATLEKTETRNEAAYSGILRSAGESRVSTDNQRRSTLDRFLVTMHEPPTSCAIAAAACVAKRSRL